MKTTVNAEDAARILGVSPDTIQLWFKRGRIRAGKSKDKRGRTVLAIPVKSLTRDLLKAKCLICGKVFRSTRPAKSKYCSYAHRMKWHARKKRRYARSGRPAKGAKPLPKDGALTAFLAKRKVR